MDFYWHGHCAIHGRGTAVPQKEVGTMGFILLGIAYIVLGIVSTARLIAGNA